MSARAIFQTLDSATQGNRIALSPALKIGGGHLRLVCPRGSFLKLPAAISGNDRNRGMLSSTTHSSCASLAIRCKSLPDPESARNATRAGNIHPADLGACRQHYGFGLRAEAQCKLAGNRLQFHQFAGQGGRQWALPPCRARLAQTAPEKHSQEVPDLVPPKFVSGRQTVRPSLQSI
jgi:hypothetical protein